MSAAAKPESQEKEKEKSLDGLSAKGKARVMEIRAKRALFVAINNESWGPALTRGQLNAFAEFMRRFKLDISEIDNLGGRPYRNGRYYMRKTAELAAAGRVEWYKGEHIGPDTRLNDMAKAGEQWAIDERNHRVRECIRLGVPAAATVAYKVTVKMKELSLPVEGVKWFTPGRKTKYDKMADPIGEDNPITSTETRAWRRAGRLFAAEIPELYAEEQEIEFAASEVAAVAVAEAEEVESEVKSLTEGPAQPLYSEKVVTEEQVNAESMPYTGTREPALWHPDTPIPKGEIGYTEPKPFERVVASTPETRAKAVETARAGVGALKDPYAETPFDGPIIYDAPQWCEPCRRMCGKSNDHEGDCMRFAE